MPALDPTFLLGELHNDIPDADVTPENWERWSRMLVLDLFARGIWKPVRVAVAITATGGVADEYYQIPDTIEDVYAVERTDNTAPYHHLEYLPSDGYEIVEREVRIFNASTATGDRYVIHGRGAYALASDLRDIFTGLVYHLLRKRYLEQRKTQRANFYLQILQDPARDTTLDQFSRMLAESEAEIQMRQPRLERADPPIPIDENA